MRSVVEAVLIFLVRTFKFKKAYSLAWKYSEKLVKNEPGQRRVACTCHGFRIQGKLDDYLFRNIYFTGKYEQEVFDVLSRFTEKVQTWLDLGSNIGFFSLYLAKNAGKVISVDANPELIRLLEDTRKLNGFENMHLLNFAVSDVSGTDVEFYVVEEEPGRSSVLRYEDLQNVKKIIVRTIAVDDIVAQHQSTIFGMKIDIEGLEILALKGAKGLLSRTPPKIIVMELSQREGVLAGPEEIIRFLGEFNYVPYVIRGGDLRRISSGSELDRELDPNAFFFHEGPP